ncbi:helix-turn-helix domain-containing protein [Flagellimonas flava]|uniref:helix-turn-helix domain-containing protein n=1 Tax=Flagellimonas flava TaxID=570519 RepID=UPI003D64D1E4
MQLDWNIALLLVVTFQFFFIAVFLLTTNPGKKESNLFLGIFFLALGINIGDMLLQMTNNLGNFQLFFLLDDALLLLFGPLIYGYVRSNIQQEFKLGPREIVHVVPFLIALAVLFLIFTKGSSSYEEVQKTITLGSSNRVLLGTIILYLHPLIYFWQSKKVLDQYKMSLKESYSNASKIDVKWFDFILLSIAAIWVLGMLHSIIPFTPLRKYLFITLFLFVVLLFAFINSVLFRVLKRPQLFLQGADGWAKKYAGSNLSEDKRVEYAEVLARRMEEDSLYTNPDLNIGDLATLMDLSSKEISQIINQTFDQHFFDFVNSYRIDACKRLLSDTDSGLTVQEIMYEVGFSSKSSFNTIFKKRTGLTPTEFRNQQNPAKK